MHKYSEAEIKKMLEFHIDNIYVVVGGQVFQQSVGIPSHGYELCPFVSGPVFVFMRRNLFKSFYMRRKKFIFL
jgi:hypothetical protein